MKKIAVCLTLMAVAFLTAKPADASMTIDNFSVGTAVFGGMPDQTDTLSALVTRTVSATNGASVAIGSGGISGAFSLTGASVQLIYDFTSPISLHDYNINHALKLNLFNSSIENPEDWRVTVSYTTPLTGTSRAPIAGFPVAIPDGPGALYFDGRTLGDGALASNVSQLKIDIQFVGVVPGDGQANFASGNAGGIAAVPEPATMALMLPALFGGAGLAWRRRRNVATEVAAV